MKIGQVASQAGVSIDTVRFYERRGWGENGTTRVVPYPPNPLDVGYSRAL